MDVDGTLAGPDRGAGCIPWRSAIIDVELCLPGAGGVPNFRGILATLKRGHGRVLAVYALYRDVADLRSLLLTERRRTCGK